MKGGSFVHKKTVTVTRVPDDSLYGCQDGLIRSVREVWEVGEMVLAGCQHKQPGPGPQRSRRQARCPSLPGTAAPRFAPMPRHSYGGREGTSGFGKSRTLRGVC